MVLACPECGSAWLTWHYGSRNNTEVAEGRLRTNDVSVHFYLGCDVCSATVQNLSSAGVAEMLNAELSKQQS